MFLATLGCLMAALGDSFAMLIGAAVLLFLFWPPHMTAQSAWQAIRERAFFADTRRLSPLTQVALAAVDVAVFAGTALLLAAAYGDAPGGRRLAALALVLPGGARPGGAPGAVPRQCPTAQERSPCRVYVCPNATLAVRDATPIDSTLTKLTASSKSARQIAEQR